MKHTPTNVELLVKEVLSLNPKSNEIGAGKLARLIELASEVQQSIDRGVKRTLIHNLLSKHGVVGVIGIDEYFMDKYSVDEMDKAEEDIVKLKGMDYDQLLEMLK